MKTAPTAAVAVTVACPPDEAFRLFTEDIDLWWIKTGPAYAFRRDGDFTMRFEPGEKGRLLAVLDEAGDRVHEIGSVLVWKPGEHLAFEWKALNFRPGQRTRVDIFFDERPNGTRVTLEHTGWETLPPDHPAMHGRALMAHLKDMAEWWQALLHRYRERGVR